LTVVDRSQTNDRSGNNL